MMPTDQEKVQNEEARKDALSRTAATGLGSATGQARENRSGAEDERLKGADKREAPEGAPKMGDFARVELPEPDGLQAEPAAFSTAGTIPSGMVSSPGGFVPISAVSDPKRAIERTLASTGRNPDDRKLTEEEVESLDGASVRAIGAQRGYEMPDMAGGRSMRRIFLEKQAEDSRFKGSSTLKKVAAAVAGR
jgi:hypothetical protein